MDFSLNDEHVALRDAVRRFCNGEYPAHEVGKPETAERRAQRWSGMAELGLLGLPFHADVGGSEQGAVELMLVAQELGRCRGGDAWISSVVLAGLLLDRAGSLEQRKHWLAPLAAGELQLALASGEPDARYDLADVQTAARRAGSDFVLNGRKSLVLHGDRAGLFLIVARTAGGRRERAGLSLFAVDAGCAGLHVQSFDTLDGGRAAHLELRDVRVSAERLIGSLDGAWPLLEDAVHRATAVLCAEAAGALEALIELSAEHLRTRKQFGLPLAKFQVLQHRIADMVIGLEQVKSMACAAAMAVDSVSPEQRDRILSAAKVLTGQIGRQVGMAAIQLHGAMGMTDECSVGHYAKRLMVINQLFGDAGHHLQRFAAQQSFHQSSRQSSQASTQSPSPSVQ